MGFIQEVRARIQSEKSADELEKEYLNLIRRGASGNISAHILKVVVLQDRIEEFKIQESESKERFDPQSERNNPIEIPSLERRPSPGGLQPVKTGGRPSKGLMLFNQSQPQQQPQSVTPRPGTAQAGVGPSSFGGQPQVISGPGSGVPVTPAAPQQSDPVIASQESRQPIVTVDQPINVNIQQPSLPPTAPEQPTGVQQSSFPQHGISPNRTLGDDPAVPSQIGPLPNSVQPTTPPFEPSLIPPPGTIDPSTGLPSPVIGQLIDPRTGQQVDEATGQPILPLSQNIDHRTGKSLLVPTAGPPETQQSNPPTLKQQQFLQKTLEEMKARGLAQKEAGLTASNLEHILGIAGGDRTRAQQFLNPDGSINIDKLVQSDLNNTDRTAITAIAKKMNPEQRDQFFRASTAFRDQQAKDRPSKPAITTTLAEKREIKRIKVKDAFKEAGLDFGDSIPNQIFDQILLAAGVTNIRSVNVQKLKDEAPGFANRGKGSPTQGGHIIDRQNDSKFETVKKLLDFFNNDQDRFYETFTGLRKHLKIWKGPGLISGTIDRLEAAYDTIGRDLESGTISVRRAIVEQKILHNQSPASHGNTQLNKLIDRHKRGLGGAF